MTTSTPNNLADPLYWITPEELQCISTSGMANKAVHILKHCFDQNGDVDLRLLEAGEGEVVKRHNDITKYLDKALLFSGTDLSGRIVDLGAGTGTLTSIISRFKNVQEVYAVEISEAYVKDIMPLVFRAANADLSKIRRIIGDFDRLTFDDNSIDCVLEYGAFHHSADIQKTIAETRRILKKGGWFIGIERARPDHLTNEELERLLDKEFPPTLKAIYGIAENQKITRRDWGEHELRRCDWNYHFSRHGFRTYVIPFVRPSGLSRILTIWYHLFGNLMLRRRMTSLPYLTWFCDRKYVKTLVLAQKA